MAGEIWHAEHEAAKVEGCALCYPEEDRQHAATQTFVDGLNVPQERCLRCQEEINPEEWKGHMMAALEGGCPLVTERT